MQLLIIRCSSEKVYFVLLFITVFLNILSLIAELRFIGAAGNLRDSHIVEVGPGPGNITQELLLKRPKSVFFVFLKIFIDESIIAIHYIFVN